MYRLHFDPISFPGMEKNQVRSAEVTRQLPLEPLISAAAARSSDRAEPPTPPPPARLCKVGTRAWSGSSVELLRRDPPPSRALPPNRALHGVFHCRRCFQLKLEGRLQQANRTQQPTWNWAVLRKFTFYMKWFKVRFTTFLKWTSSVYGS